MALSLEELEQKEREGSLLPVEQQQLDQLRANDEAMFSFMPPARDMMPQRAPQPGQGQVMPQPAAPVGAMPPEATIAGSQRELAGVGMSPQASMGGGQPLISDESGMMKWATLLAPFIGMLGGAAVGGKRGAAMGLLGGSKFTQGYDTERERQREIESKRGSFDLTRRETESQIGLRGAQQAKIEAELKPVGGMLKQRDSAVGLKQWDVAARLSREMGEDVLADAYNREAQEELRDKVYAYQAKGLNDAAMRLASESEDQNLIDEVMFINEKAKTDAATKRAINATELRKEFVKASKEFEVTRDAMGRVEAAADDPSPAGDLALIFNYMKVLDPSSVVRESEFQTASATGSLEQRAEAFLERMTGGKRLSASQRFDFVARAQKLFESQMGIQEKRVSTYRRIAGEIDVDPELVTIDLSLPQFRGPQKGDTQKLRSGTEVIFNGTKWEPK